MSNLVDIIDHVTTGILDDLGLTHSHKVHTETSSSPDDTRDREFYDICDFCTSYSLASPHDEILAAETPNWMHMESQKADQIKDVIFDKRATTIIWANGEKTTVKAFCEPIDHEKGLAMAIVKHSYQSGDGSSNKASFYKLIADAEDAELDRIVKKAMKELRKVYSDALIKECEKVSTFPIDDATREAFYGKALKATMRVRKKYIPTETGLPEARIEKGIQEALEAYSANCMRQRVF